MYKFSSNFKSGTKKTKFNFFKGNKEQWMRVGGIALAVLFVLGVIGYFVVFQPAMKIRAAANEVMKEVKILKKDIKSNDIDLINKHIDNLSKKYQAFEKEAAGVYWATFIPYVSDFKNGVEAGRYVIKASDEAVTAIYPYADLIGLKKGQENFYEKSAEERLQTAVLTLDKMLTRIDVVAKNIDEAEKRIETINPGRYPKKIGSYVIRETLEQAKDQFEGMATLFVDSKPFLKQLPDILGSKEEKNYLILFQNTAERRATGGFFTFYAVFNINKGKISIKDSSDIYDLDNNIAVHPKAPDKILAYHKDVARFC